MSSVTCSSCRQANSSVLAACAGCGTPLVSGLSATCGVEGQEGQPGISTIDPYGGRVFGQCRVDGPIGAGGMGIVYRGTHLKLGRPVALKFLPATRTADPMARARFFREARAASALDHPNIGTIYDVDEAGGIAYIMMAYYDGETLRSRIEKGPLSVSETARIAGALAAALEAAHRAGITHRDIKPANVMLTQDRQVKLLDFGLAKVDGREDQTLTREGAVIGTIPYMSPEQLRAEPADARADLWSLGVVIHEMLTASQPFSGATSAVVSAQILERAPAPLPASVPPALRQLVTALLQKDAGARPASASEVMAALATPDELPASPASRRWLGFALGGGIGCSLLAGLLFSRTPAPRPPPAAVPMPQPVAAPPAPILPARLSATTNARSAIWWLDDKRVASEVGAVALEVPPGAHRLRVEAQRYLPHESAFVAMAGQTVELRCVLQPRPRSKKEVVWPPPE